MDAQQLVATDLDSRVRRSLWISGAKHPQVPARKFFDEEERLSICRHEHPFTGLISVCRDGVCCVFTLSLNLAIFNLIVVINKRALNVLFLHRNDGELALPVRLECDYVGWLDW